MERRIEFRERRRRPSLIRGPSSEFDLKGGWKGEKLEVTVPFPKSALIESGNRSRASMGFVGPISFRQSSIAFFFPKTIAIIGPPDMNDIRFVKNI